jgi:hypothetical protein
VDISYQSHQGHTTLTDLTDQEVEVKFRELTGQRYRAFASTSLAEPVGPFKTLEEVPADTKELYFVAPLEGG